MARYQPCDFKRTKNGEWECGIARLYEDDGVEYIIDARCRRVKNVWDLNRIVEPRVDGCIEVPDSGRYHDAKQPQIKSGLDLSSPGEWVRWG